MFLPGSVFLGEGVSINYGGIYTFQLIQDNLFHFADQKEFSVKVSRNLWTHPPPPANQTRGKRLSSGKDKGGIDVAKQRVQSSCREWFFG